MLLTEDQAREKWCPQARAVEMDSGDGYGSEPITGYPVGNRSAVGHVHPFCRCIASDCMSWRWEVGPPTQLEKAAYDETSDTFRHCGFCGLAGKPA